MPTCCLQNIARSSMPMSPPACGWPAPSSTITVYREFLELGFKYDNLLMEESAQILEIETFIPVLLQVSRRGQGRCCVVWWW